MASVLLYSKLFRNYRSKYVKQIINLRDIRNTLLFHSSNLRLNKDEYDKSKNEIEKIAKELSFSINCAETTLVSEEEIRIRCAEKEYLMRYWSTMDYLVESNQRMKEISSNLNDLRDRVMRSIDQDRRRTKRRLVKLSFCISIMLCGSNEIRVYAAEFISVTFTDIVTDDIRKHINVFISSLIRRNTLSSNLANEIFTLICTNIFRLYGIEISRGFNEVSGLINSIVSNTKTIMDIDKSIISSYIDLQDISSDNKTLYYQLMCVMLDEEKDIPPFIHFLIDAVN